MMDQIGVEAMSSDEEVNKGRKDSFFLVAEKPWRSGELSYFLWCIDVLCSIRKTEQRGQTTRKRRRDVPEDEQRISTSRPTRPGAWKNCYNPTYLKEEMSHWEVQQLHIQPFEWDFTLPDWVARCVSSRHMLWTTLSAHEL